MLALVEAAVPGVTVFDGRVPDGQQEEIPPERYVALYIDHGSRDPAARVDHASTSRTWRWQTTCVAPDREAAAWLAERVADGLTGVRPIAAGWSPGLIDHIGAQLPRPDELVQERPTVIATDQYQLIAERKG